MYEIDSHPANNVPCFAASMTHFYGRRLDDPARIKLLDDVVRRIGERGQRDPAQVVVFDLDGTLLDNRPRVVAILHELAEEWNHAHPDEAALCRTATAERIGYGFIDNLISLGVGDPDRQAHGLDFWKARFFADPHLAHDIEVPGACAFAWRCYRAGAVLVYLTGRDLPNMSVGSFASLRDRGFPIGVVGTELVTKPAFDIPDEVYKRDVAPALSRLGNVVAVFDNEAANCNLFQLAHPSATTVFLDTQYAPNPPALHDAIHVIQDFVVPR